MKTNFTTIYIIMIAVHGNIGAGKSTLLKQLAMLDEQFIIYLEPVETWTSCENMLNLFYTDPYAYAFKFQTLALITRLKQYSEYVENKENKIMIWERGSESDIIFKTLLTKKGYLTKLDNDILGNAYKPKAILNIYIRVSPEVCLNRILKRGRMEEVDISYEYLKELHDEHEKVFKNCYIVDGENIDINDVYLQIKRSIREGRRGGGDVEKNICLCKVAPLNEHDERGAT